MEVVARTTVSPKQTLVLVKLGRRLVLVGVSPDRMDTMATVDDPDQVALLMGEIESQRPESAAQAFVSSFGEQRRAYADPSMTEDPEAAVGGQVRGLLTKVRRLARRREVA